VHVTALAETATGRHALARLTAPLSFVTRRRIARQLFKFALAEQESMLELRAAAALSSSPERRALYLRHALDEERHATMFALHAAEIRRSLGLAAWGHPRTHHERLFERLGEARFLAFVHRGEHRGRVQFEAYAAYFERRGDDKLRALFTALIADERRHERYTGGLLVECAGSEARHLLLRTSAWEALRGWRRGGQGIARLVYLACMTVLYACLAPFAIVLRLARPDRGGHWDS
jgi:rubrerythrin